MKMKMESDTGADKKEFWREVLSLFFVILGIVTTILLFATLMAYIIKHSTYWMFVPIILLMIFGGSCLAVYLDRRVK